MLSDYRKDWMKERVLTFLNEDNNSALFNNLLYRNEGKVASILNEFLNKTLIGTYDHEHILVYFYKTYYDKTIHEEMNVQEAVTVPSPVLEPEPESVRILEKEVKKKKIKSRRKSKGDKKNSVGTDAIESSVLNTNEDKTEDQGDSPDKETAVDHNEDEVGEETQSHDESKKDSEKKKDKRGKKNGKPKKGKKGRKSPVTLVEEAPKEPTPPPEYVTIKKIVTRVVPAPQLHCHFGLISGNKVDFNQQYIYFIRQCWHSVPLTDTWEEAIAEMPLYFLVGSSNGNFLDGLNKLVKQVFIPLIANQFQDPLLELKLKSKMNEEGATHHPPTLEAFSRPSDFWRMAMKMKQGFLSEEGYVENPDPDPNESVKADQKSLDNEDDSQSSSEIEPEVCSAVSVSEDAEENNDGAIDLDELVAAHLGMPIGQITSTIRRKSSGASVMSRRSSSAHLGMENLSKCEPLKFEMLTQLKSLVQMTNWTQNHLIGDVSLAVPNIPELLDPSMKPELLCQNKEVVKKLEETTKIWNERITKNLTDIIKKKPVGDGPIVEYNYWYELEAELSILQEQLNAPSVCQVVEILLYLNSQNAIDFKTTEEKLHKHYIETRDNVRFLSTVLCHFKMLVDSNSLSAIKNCLSALMEGLRIIWYLSAYYSVDDNMALLLRRIKWALCSKVSSVLDVSKLFNYDLKTVERLTNEALELLTSWKQYYLEMRMKIETSGKGVRWEFDKTMLFSESDYMATVASNLNRIAKVMLEFHNIFGAELKSIISDPVQIDAVVKRVESMFQPIVKADFEIFSSDSRESWENIVQWFENQVASIENEAKYFINESFTLLRCSEEALEMLQKFKFIETRPAIKNQLETKYEPILHQFMKEISLIENIFQSQKANPPLLRNHPPVAGSIFWERLLFHRIKRPVLAFQKVDELTRLDAKKPVFQEYLLLVKQMKEYEDKKFEEWSKRVVALIEKAMHKEIIELVEIERFVDLALNEQSKKSKESDLRLISLKHLKQLRCKKSKGTCQSKSIKKNKTITNKIGGKSKNHDINHAEISAASMTPFALTMKWLTQSQAKSNNITSTKYGIINPPSKIKQLHSVAWGNFIKDALLIELKLGVRLNFTESLFEVISEAKLMEQLNFKLPSAVQKLISIQFSLFDSYTIVRKMVSEYCKLLDCLDVPQLLFAKDHLRDVENQLQPGLVRINWTSLQIKEFAVEVLKKINNLKSLVQQMDDASEKLNEKMALIGSFDLFFHAQSFNSISRISCMDFFRTLESIQSERMGKILYLYKLLGPILMKLESTVLRTNTGQSPFMVFYYNNCEKKIFSTFIEVCIQNLKRFNDFLKGDKALIIVEAQLGLQDIHLEPSFTQIYNLIILAVRQFIEKFKFIPRWMNGTCLLCSAVFSEDKKSQHIFSFYDDLIRVQGINDVLLQIKDTTHRLVLDLHKYLSKWKKYCYIWLLDKDANVDKFAAKNPKLNAYEEKFSFYSDILDDLNSLETYIDIQCIQINLNKLIDSIKLHLISWKNKLGEKLAFDTRKLMNNFKMKISELKNNLELGVSEVTSFKIVLQAIADINLLVVESELIFNEIDERYHSMSLQNITVLVEDKDLFFTLKSDWNSLLDTSIYRKLALEPAKSVFAKITEGEIRRFGIQTDEFAKRFYEDGPGSIGKDLKTGEPIISKWRSLFASMNSQREEMLKVEKLFDLPMLNYDNYLKAYYDFQGMEIIYELYHRQKASCEQWGKTLWINFSSQFLLDGINVFIEEYQRLPKEVQTLEVGVALQTLMLQFKESIPLFIKLRNEAIRSRHWKELMVKTGKYFDVSTDTFNLECVMDMELFNHKAICTEIIDTAIKELTIELSIDEINNSWNSLSLQVVKHVRSDDDYGYMLGDPSQLLSFLDDHSIMLQNMANSDYVGSFLSAVQMWETNLSIIGEVLDEWILFQHIWLYLGGGIFSNPDIYTQLPEETKIFDHVNKTYKKIMLEVFKNPKVLDQCLNIPDRIKEFKSLSLKLEQCQKSLDSILEWKRNVYPRFFFLSDKELLNILGSLKPTNVQQFLSKMFDNIRDWTFTKDNDGKYLVRAVVSNEGETIELKVPQSVSGPIEDWMNSVTLEISQTHRFLSKKAIFDYGKIIKSRLDWILDFQGTVCYCANSVWWTAEVENVFSQEQNCRAKAMKEQLKVQNDQLNELSKFIRGCLSNLDQKKMSNMMIVDIHSRDIVEHFVQNNIVSENDFEWKRQLRFYWRKEVDNLSIQQCSAMLLHGHEYSGLSQRLVMTNLSDRIHFTIIQALYLHLGASPVGSSGSGKTETIKDLAKTLGLLCIVTHCNKAMDYLFFHQILNGLIQCGVWGCFESLHEVKMYTLSFVSTLMQSVFSATKSKAKKVFFDGQEINFDEKVNLLITVNPSCFPFSGFPELMKSCFRSVACLVPDLEFICCVYLLSKGFLQSKLLAKKVTTLFKLSSSKLSRQLHYDFGIRALKFTLSNIGELKKTNEFEESLLIVKVIKNAVLPKLISEDIPLFLGLMKDIFVEIDHPNFNTKELTSSIKMAFQEGGYTLVDKQIEKCQQLWEVMQVHHSCMLIGPSGSGKSAIFATLEKMNRNLGSPAKIYTVSPKSCSFEDFYGHLDSKTRVWNDGILTSIFGEMNSVSKKSEKKFLLFDGEVDSSWVENILSLMDPSKHLALANGERIQLMPHCSLLFEGSHLQNASPSIVSRFGIVYINSADLGPEPFWKRWMSKYNDEDVIKSFNHLFEKYIQPVLAFFYDGERGTEKKNLVKTVVSMTPLSMVVQFCFIMDVFLMHFKPKKDKIEDDVLEALFIEGLYASFGAVVSAETKATFDSSIKNLSGFKSYDEEISNLPSLQFLPSMKPTLYDYSFDLFNKCWVAWDDLKEPYVHSPNLKFDSIFVPTSDSTRLSSYLSRINEFYFDGKPHLIKKPTMLISEGSSFKTAFMNHFLRNIDRDKFVQLRMNFCSETTSSDIQRGIEMFIEKRTRKVYGPPVKKLVCFFDDFNMPKVDDYGTQQTTAFLKLMCEKDGYYHCGGKVQWRNIKDTSYYFGLTQNGGGQDVLDPRFTSLVYIYNVTQMSDETISSIFSTILKCHTAIFSSSIQESVADLINATLEIFKIISVEMPPIPHKFHYIFNVRDLSRIVAGLHLTSRKIFTTVKQFIRVWRNEFTRVISDRLIYREDKSVVEDHLLSVVSKYFPSHVDYVMRNPLLFGDFRNAMVEKENETRDYEDLLDYDAVFHLFEEILLEHNERNPKMSLVLFNDALEHLTRIQRIFRMKNGHIMVLGPNGIGKQSLVRLAAFTAGCEVLHVCPSQYYSKHHFIAEIKQLFLKTGIHKKSMILLLNASQTINKGLFKLLNDIISSCISPFFFSEEDRQSIIDEIKQNDSENPIQDEEIWTNFIAESVKNIHVALTISMDTSGLRSLCQNFLGLLKNMSINCCFDWPPEAFNLIARQFLDHQDLLPDEFAELVANQIVYAHSTINKYTSDYSQMYRQQIYITPMNFFNCIHSYLDLLLERNEAIVKERQVLTSGISKMTEVFEHSEELKAKLAIKSFVISEKSDECRTILEDISNAVKESDEKKEEIEERNKELAILSKEISDERFEVEEMLSKVLPSLLAAKETVRLLTEEDISEMFSLSTPPEAVQNICECVIILLGTREVSWKKAKIMMSDNNFLQNLINLDCNLISHKQQQACRVHLKSPKKMEVLKDISKAGYSFLLLIEAILGYCIVFKEVKPKNDKIAALEEEISALQKHTDLLNYKLNEAFVQLNLLHDSYKKGIAEKKNLQAEKATIESMIVSADELVSVFNEQYISWNDGLEHLSDAEKQILGDCLVCALFLSYAGPFNPDFRHKIIFTDWLNNIASLNIPVSKPFTLLKILTNDATLHKWSLEGLPMDSFAIQNGIIIERHKQYPICIDPQQQAFKWIMQHEQNVKVVSFNDQDYLAHLENALKTGSAILFQEINSIDPIMFNILDRKIMRSGNDFVVMLGDKQVEYNAKCRIYFTTLTAYPEFSQAVFTKTIVINFSITHSGLSEKLISLISEVNNKNFEDERIHLIEEQFTHQKNLKKLKSSFTDKLLSSNERILDDSERIQPLLDLSTQILDIEEKLKLCTQRMTTIEEVRQTFASVAHPVAHLFFILVDLSLIDFMYQFSLDSFLMTIKKALQNLPPIDSFNCNSDQVLKSLIYSIYESGCFGIFKKHKLYYSFQIAVKIDLFKGSLSQLSVNFFFNSFVPVENESQISPVTWLSNRNWCNVIKLSQDFPGKFSNLPEDIKTHSEDWEVWYHSSEIESTDSPNNYTKLISFFDKLLLISSFRPDRLCITIQKYVDSVLGIEFLSPPLNNLTSAYEYSSPLVPIILILSSNVDPSFDISRLFSNYHDDYSNLKFLTLGEEQEKAAFHLLESSLARGSWLVIQHCHLSMDFLKDLEKQISKIIKVHPNFRLWLTTHPIKSFPLRTLRNSVKIVIEVPQSLKSSIRNTYLQMDREIFECCHHPDFKSILYVLSFFHAVIQERGVYGKIGWNMPYEFSKSDFNISVCMIEPFLTESFKANSSIFWSTLKFLIGEVVYGGKIIEEWDRFVMNTLINEYFGDFLFDKFQVFHFYESAGVKYNLPKGDTIENFLKSIEELPDMNYPGVLGFYENVQMKQIDEESARIWTTLRKLQLLEVGSKLTSENEKSVALTVKDILTKVVRPFDVERIRNSYKMVITPTAVVLLQELSIFNSLLEQMHHSLTRFQKALFGKISMDESLEITSRSILCNHVPNTWQKFSPETYMSLGKWLEHFERRKSQFLNWSVRGDPVVIWLSGLCSPQSYLTALLQTACKKQSWMLDRSSFYTVVTNFMTENEVEERPEIGCYVEGLFIEGGRWDSQKACLAEPNCTTLIEEMPIILVQPVEACKLRLENTIRVPVYVTSQRCNAEKMGLVFEADLVTDKHKSFWILSGVCLVLNDK